MELENYSEGKLTKSNVELPTSLKGGIYYNLLLSICDRLISSNTNESLLLDYILREIIVINKSDIGSISSKSKSEDNSNYLNCISSEESPSNLQCAPLKSNPEGLTQKKMDNLFGLAITKECAIISNDVKNDPRSHHPTLPISHPYIKTFLSIPLYSETKIIIGQISLANKKVETQTSLAYSENDIIELSNLLPIISKLLNKIFKNRRKTFSSKDIKEIKDKDDIKDNFLAMMSHELKTPLNGIVGMTLLLSDTKLLSKKQEEYVTNLMECSHQLMNLINNFLDFTKMSSDRLVLLNNPLDINKSIKDSEMMVIGNAKSKKLNLVIDVQGKPVINTLDIPSIIVSELNGVGNEELPMMIGDSQRLTQIVTNLLSNSVKYTEKGEIKLTVRGNVIGNGHNSNVELLKNSNSSDSSGCLLDVNTLGRKWKIIFEVKDTGIGIPPAEQEKIFEFFHRSSYVNTGKYSGSGTGLGLSIAKELVRLMNGKITVRSDGVNGKGSTFTFYIIVNEDIQIVNLQQKYQDLIHDSKILVVDDRPENRLLMTDMLFNWGCNPTALSSGEEALRYLKRVTYGCAIVDINMPLMTGIELAQIIREKYKNLPIIALSSVDLTSKDSKGNPARELFDYYLNKPVDQTTLFPLLLDCLIKQSQTVTEIQPQVSNKRNSISIPKGNESKRISLTTPEIRFVDLKLDLSSLASSKEGEEIKSARKKKSKKHTRILIAEDDQMNRYTIKEFLLKLGYSKHSIFMVENGKECVDLVKKTYAPLGTDQKTGSFKKKDSSEQPLKKFDIILMDIKMPVMDGIEATKHIRQLPEHPYIIAVSASVQASDKQKCQNVGIDGYLTKPIEFDKLDAILTQFIKNH